MNYDGVSIRSAVKFQSMPVFLSEKDLVYNVENIVVSLPAYNNSDRILLQKCVLAIRLQYRFTSSPLLFKLKLIDSRTQEVLGESPYGQEDFSVDWHTMQESFLLDEFDSRYIQVHLIMDKDDTQNFVIKSKSFISINVL
jgi:hypothetical protein